MTPNVAEARALAAAGPHAEIDELARAVHALGPAAVVVTGGHREQAVDVFFDGDQLVEIPGERYVDGAAHGSGCTHSSALAAYLALGYEPLEAARAVLRGWAGGRGLHRESATRAATRQSDRPPAPA